MATQYTSILKLALPTEGELSGTWGDVVNDNITSMVEEAIAGRAVIDSWTANGHTLTTADGTTAEARCAMLEFTDTNTDLTGNAEVICPTASKIYVAKNATGAGYSVTLKTSAGTGIAVPDGETMFLFCDGTNVVEAVTSVKTLKIADGVQVNTILDEDNMASDSATALATQQSIKAYVDAQVTAQDLDIAGDSGTGAVDLDSESLTVAGTTDEIETSASGQTITVGLPSAVVVTTSVTTPTVQATNINANDGSTSATIADSTGVMTIASSVLTTTDINGGTVDGVTIGGASAGAGTFTTATTTTGVVTDTISERTATSGVTIDSVVLKDGGITATGGGSLTGTWSDLGTVTTVDIDGGTIDDTTIGGSTPAAGSFTTFTSNGIDDNADATAITIDSDERVLIGGLTSARQIAGAERGGIQVEGLTGAPSNISITRTQNNGAGPQLMLTKNRGSSFGDEGIVVVNDVVGEIRFLGSDGTTTSTTSTIESLVDGTPGVSDTPGRLVFSTTADGASSPTERMRITNDGKVGINCDPAVALEVRASSPTFRLTADTDGESAVHFGDTGDGNIGYIKYEHTDNEMVFRTDNTEAMRIDSSQRVLIGGASSVGISGYGNYLQLQGTTGSDAGISVQRYNNGAGAPVFNFGKTRSTTVGTVGTVVQDGDALGYIFWSGDDGTDVESNAAYIVSEVDGTPGSNDMPGRLVFFTTADGNSSPTEHMRIDNAGNVGIANTNPTVSLEIGSNASGSTLTSGNGSLSLNRNGDTFLEFHTSGGSQSSKILFNQAGTEVGNIEYVSSSLRFDVNQAEAMRIDSSQRILIGENTSVPIVQNDSALYVGGVTTAKSQVGIARYVDSASAPVLALAKSRSSANGSVGTVVQDDDFLGFIYFAGDDGTDLATRGALIVGEVDGTPGSNDMPGRISFSTTSDGASSPTERVRINALGDFRVAMDNFGNQVSSLNGGASLRRVNDGGYFEISRLSTAARNQVIFYNPNGAVGTITTSGSATAYNTSSDYRLKEDWVPMSDSIARVKALNPVNFAWKVDGTRVDGFLAHEAQEIVPEAVTGKKDAVDEDGNPEYQGIDQAKLVPLLTAALQEAIAKIEALEARVATLEAN